MGRRILRRGVTKTSMGLEIDRESFETPDFERFGDRLRDSLRALEILLDRSDFGHGPPSIGAEVELHLVDARGRPAHINRAVKEAVNDPRLTLEVDRFNLEMNSRPVALSGRPFSSIRDDLGDTLERARAAAALSGARIVTIGILPTLSERDLTSGALTESLRFRALSAGLRRLRSTPFPLRIEGEDVLDVAVDDVTFEGANTSFQVHLRVDPAEFARMYNAAQIAAGPVLAMACNSPLFLGKRLWDETRIALFRQAVDDREDVRDDDWRPARVSFGHGWVRHGALELFREAVAQHAPILPVVDHEDPLEVVFSGGVPGLRELRLHQSTVWPWNRAIYDGADGGHLRIEMRALPAGPTVVDMVANAAFLIGLVRGLAPDVDQRLATMTFAHARRNFYEAARRGLAAELLFAEEPGGPMRPHPAPMWLERLLPIARRGLRASNVEAEEIDRWIGIVEHRLAAGMTGASWQRRVFASCHSRRSADAASVRLLDAYMRASESELPVSAWDRP